MNRDSFIDEFCERFTNIDASRRPFVLAVLAAFSAEGPAYDKKIIARALMEIVLGDEATA